MIFGISGTKRTVRNREVSVKGEVRLYFYRAPLLLFDYGIDEHQQRSAISDLYDFRHVLFQSSREIQTVSLGVRRKS